MQQSGIVMIEAKMVTYTVTVTCFAGKSTFLQAMGVLYSRLATMLSAIPKMVDQLSFGGMGREGIRNKHTRMQ